MSDCWLMMWSWGIWDGSSYLIMTRFLTPQTVPCWLELRVTQRLPTPCWIYKMALTTTSAFLWAPTSAQSLFTTTSTPPQSPQSWTWVYFCSAKSSRAVKTMASSHIQSFTMTLPWAACPVIARVWHVRLRITLWRWLMSLVAWRVGRWSTFWRPVMGAGWGSVSVIRDWRWIMWRRSACHVRLIALGLRLTSWGRQLNHSSCWNSAH